MNNLGGSNVVLYLTRFTKCFPGAEFCVSEQLANLQAFNMPLRHRKGIKVPRCALQDSYGASWISYVTYAIKVFRNYLNSDRCYLKQPYTVP